MKAISQWAHKHPAKAIWIIVVLQACLAFLWVSTGIQLHKLHIMLPYSGLLLAAIALAGIYFIYPWHRASYVKRKVLEALFLFSCAIGIITWSNNLNNENSALTYRAYASALPAKEKKPTAQQILQSLQYRDKSTLTKQEKRILKREFKVQLKKHIAAKQQGNDEESKRTWLTILAIIGIVGLTLLLAALVCSISCGGSGGAAVLVALAGAAGVVFLSIAIFKAINKKHRKKEVNPGIASPQ